MLEGDILQSTMTKAQMLEKVLELPVEERLEVAEAIWASLDPSANLPLPDWQRELLDERIAVAESDPHAGTPWPKVKELALKAL